MLHPTAPTAARVPAPDAPDHWYRRLVESTPDIVTVLSPEGLILYDSPAVSRVLGYAQGELVGHSAFALVHPDDLAVALDLLLRTVARPGCVSSLVIRFRHRDGGWRCLECVGSVAAELPTARAVVVTSRDVTARERVERERGGLRGARGDGAETLQVEMLERLAGAAELRDDDTGRHIRRVAEVAAALAALLGLPAPEVERIRRAAPLHDLGKIGIPDAILRKRGPLAAEETEVMRLHTTLGARLLAGGQSELIRTAEGIALHHHERWDGNGYPQRLRGEQIPLPARIVAVADVFDALTHARPYRPARPRAEALAVIRQGRGTHFDPDAADALLRLAPLRG